MPMILKFKSGERVGVREDSPFQVLERLEKGLLPVTFADGHLHYVPKEWVVGYTILSAAEVKASEEAAEKAKAEQAEAEALRKKKAEAAATVAAERERKRAENAAWSKKPWPVRLFTKRPWPEERQ